MSGLKFQESAGLGGAGFVYDDVHFVVVRDGGIERQPKVRKLARFALRLFGASQDQCPAVLFWEEMDSRTLRAWNALSHTSKFGPRLMEESRGRP